MRVATDIGGTFTDLVFFTSTSQSNHYIGSVKSHTTPQNFENGIMDAIESAEITLRNVDFLAHGTTIVINAITERKGAKTGLITTKGFRDVLEIARANRPDLFNFNFIKQAPFVERHLRLEVDERVNYKGKILKAINPKDVLKAIKVFRKEKVKSIAICCLHAYSNPENEIAIAKILNEKAPEFTVTCSYQVNREWREYERTSSTVLSAYVKPVANVYLQKLESRLHKNGFTHRPYVMQSNGGISTIDTIKDNPITIIESGPAAGMFGAAALAKVIKKKDLIVLDIGGTTAKCSLIKDGQLRVITNYKIEHSKTQAGYPVQTPVIDIVEIGNGGGSIAWLDEGNKLHVGPQSAGAEPGPACYGKGGQLITTTDANVLCGRIHPDFFLGGSQKPDLKNMNKAFEPLQKQLGTTKIKIAKGILDTANANMVNALKLISVNKGYDPRQFSLVVIGGGGAMHAPFLADELHIPEIIVPHNAGVFSALGMLMTDLRRDFIRTRVLTLQKDNIKIISKTIQEMKSDAMGSYKKDGYNQRDIHFDYFADLRYTGQEHYVKVPVSWPLKNQKDINSIIESFHKAHKKEYTFELSVPVEWVNFHLVATIVVNKAKFPKLKKSGHNQHDIIYGERTVDFGKFGKVKTKIYKRSVLSPGIRLSGPAIVAEDSSSTLLPPGHSLIVDQWGNLIIKKNKG